MIGRLVSHIFCILFFSSILLGQANIASDSLRKNLSDNEKETIIEQWIQESENRKKWSHKVRIDFALAAYEMSSVLGKEKLKMGAMYSLAELYFNQGKFQQVKLFFDTLEVYGTNTRDYQLLVNIKSITSTIYRYRGDYYGALTVAYEAYQIAVENNLDILLPLSLNNLGIIYRHLGDDQKARDFFDDGLSHALELSDTSQTIQSHINIGNLYWYSKELGLAENYYQKGLRLAEWSNDVQHLATLNNNLGNIWREKLEFKLALQYYNRALDYLNNISLVGLESVILRNIGLTFHQADSIEQALTFINKSLDITESIHLITFSIENYYALSQIYHDMGDMEQAYFYMNNYLDLNQEIFNEQLLSSLTYFNEKVFDAERKQQHYKFQLERNLLITMIVILAFVFMGILAFVLFRNNRLNRSHLKKLESSIREKEITEAALRQSEENYQIFIRSLNEALIVLDTQNHIEFVNHKACLVLAADSQDVLLGRDFKQFLLTPEDERVFRDKMELQKIGISDNYEVQMKNINGDVMWVNLSSAPILDPFQKTKGSVNLISDVTDRKHTEQNYNDLTTNLNQKIKQLNCMYDISDISGVPGISFEEIIEKSLEIIPVGLKYTHDIAVQIMFNDKIYASKNYKETPWSYTVPIKVQKKKLGYLKVLYLEEKPLINRDAFHFNEKILLKNISEKFGQILEAKNMERIFRDSQEKLQEVQKLAKIGNWEHHLISNHCTFSDTFYEITDISVEKRKFFDYDRFIELIHPDDKKIVEYLDADLLRKESSPIISINYRIITPKGIIKHIYSTRKIVRNKSGEIIRCVYTVQDITEQKTNQELKYNIEVALKTSEAKQQFLANMSHEMRTPMNGIMGMVDFLLKTNLSVEQLDFAKTIKDSSEGLLNILNDILDLSKIEAGKFLIKNQTFEIESLLNKTKELFAALTRHKDLHLKVDLDTNIPPKIITDENRLYQVITYLVSNAVKYSESGDIILTMKLQSYQIDQLEITVEVVDNGPGLKESEIQNLFKPLSQIDEQHVKKNEGTGLGLAISKKLVELLGGNIGVRNNATKGCTFFFTFNAKRPKNTLVAPQVIQNSSNTAFQSLEGVRVLCVDDKKVNQKVVTLMLTHVHCAVSLASNGKEALELLKKNDFDVILLDIVMPEMDGIATIREIKKHFTNHPPVIALSANVMQEDKDEYLAEGMNDYISKPINAEELYKKLGFWSNYKLQVNKVKDEQ